MKLLIIIDSLGSGGAEKSTAVLADHLNDSKIPFEILCLERKDVGVQQEMGKKGYKIRFLKSIGFFAQVKEISKIIISGRFEIVHSILFNSNIRTRFAKQHSDFIHVESLVSTTYSKERFEDPKVNSIVLRLYKILDQYTAKKYVDHFHSISEAVKNHYIKHLGIDPTRISVIYRGRKPILTKVEKFSIKNKKIQLLNIGRNEFAKGQIYLLHAAKKLKDKGCNFQLKIFGREGNVTPELNSYIENNNLQDVVSLEGFKNDLSKIFLEADIFVFPSLYEGLGGALIEAQSAGLPIVCNDIPIFHEVVNKDVNAKFFNVKDLDSIVNALSILMTNANMRREFGIESFKNFTSKFSEEEINHKMIQLYKSLIN